MEQPSKRELLHEGNDLYDLPGVYAIAFCDTSSAIILCKSFSADLAKCFPDRLMTPQKTS